MNRLTRVLAVLMAAASLVVPLCARADYPERLVRIVVPYPPGGGMDSVTRTIAARLTELVDSLDLQKIHEVSRAFTLYFQLINVAEDHHRARVLRARLCRLRFCAGVQRRQAGEMRPRSVHGREDARRERAPVRRG